MISQVPNLYLEEQGYEIVHLKNGRRAGLFNFIFTVGIIADFTWTGYDARWCYYNMREARQALKEWDGRGEPQGWHRALTIEGTRKNYCDIWEKPE